MRPLTHQRLAANAYRTLGLSASADLAAIESAARRMRIWPDPERIPPTAWDLAPWLGPIGRSRGDIERAVALLNEPQSRVEERMLWYHGDVPPKLSSQLPVDSAAGSEMLVVHNQTLAALHLAYKMDPAMSDVGRWRRVVERIAALSGSREYVLWMEQAEKEGEFEKRAATDELRSAASSLGTALAAAMLPRAQEALERHDLHAATKVVSLIRDAGQAREVAAAIRQLLDGLEDRIRTLCIEMDADLRAKLRTIHTAPAPYYEKNRVASLAATQFYNKQIDPTLTMLHALAGDDKDRLVRCGAQCAKVLTLLALGWEWAGEFKTAEQKLRLAMGLVDGRSATAATLRDNLARCTSSRRQVIVKPKTPFFSLGLPRHQTQPKVRTRFLVGMIALLLGGTVGFFRLVSVIQTMGEERDARPRLEFRPVNVTPNLDRWLPSNSEPATAPVSDKDDSPESLLRKDLREAASRDRASQPEKSTPVAPSIFGETNRE